MNVKLVLCFPLFIFSFCLYAQTGNELPFQKWAITPPMGWNSWDCYGPTVVESEVKANADYMAEHLKDYGWEYVVVDIRWFVENDKAGGYNQTNPIYCYDEYGRYIPATNRFPSASEGAGFKPLGDYIHSKGLKFGIHIMRGIPKIAVQKKLPIKDANGITAADIYSTALQCTWLKDNYTIVASKPGAQEYYNSIFELYASWGVDLIKIDDLSRPYHQEEIEMIRKAIDKTGRPIVLSMSPGETPLDKAIHTQNNANMWRTVDDMWDNWDQLFYQFAVCDRWSPYIAPGTWPDADMLPLGRISIRGERGDDRMTNLTKDEQYTLMSLWTIFKSPLMFGGDLPSNDDFTNSLLTNEEVLYMHKRSVNNKQWFNNDGRIAWMADDPATGDKFLAVFNTGDNGFIKTHKALYRSGLISRLTDNYGVDIDIPLPEDTQDLYLIITDGGDGSDCDHADWINPIIYKENGEELQLTNLEWVRTFSGWGSVNKNKNTSGGTLNIQGKTYSNGIGTHANSMIQYSIPEGYVGFRAFAGLDKGGTDQSGGATVEFMLFDSDPTLRQVDVDKAVANSGFISRTHQREGVQLVADITGATKLYLVVTDAGDNYNYDHADWINPTISKPDGTKLDLTTINWVKATSGWDTVKKNKSLNNGTLKVNGLSYSKGFGVNSYSTIEFDIPEGYTEFTAFCGFDDEVLNADNGVTIEFMVFITDPSNDTESSVPLNMEELGYKGQYKVRDMWQKEDLGVFSGNEFVPVLKPHASGLYRISAMDRTNEATITLSAETSSLNEGDKVSFNISVLSTGNEKPTGSVLVMQNEEIVGVIPLDNEGKASFLSDALSSGTYRFTTSYSGNAFYNPAVSDAVILEVKALGQKNIKKKVEIAAHCTDGCCFLTGMSVDDEISIYDISGLQLSQFKATSTIEKINFKGLIIIKVKSGDQTVSLKVVN